VSPTPVSPERLTRLLGDLIAASAREGRVRVAFDGADAAAPGSLADAVADDLRRRGLAAVRVRSRDFLRPASLRYEYGRTDPDAFRTGWLDAGALAREVLTPFAADGRYLPSLWDAAADRATRATYEQAPARAAALVDGPLLLGRGLPFDLAIHLHLGAAALRRRSSPADAWTLEAFARYADEIDPLACADVTVRVDDPRHPAVELRGA
jgi:hypothetical protein